MKKMVLCHTRLKLEECTKDIEINLKKKAYELSQALSQQFSSPVTHNGGYWLYVQQDLNMQNIQESSKS